MKNQAIINKFSPSSALSRLSALKLFSWIMGAIVALKVLLPKLILAKAVGKKKSPREFPKLPKIQNQNIIRMQKEIRETIKKPGDLAKANGELGFPLVLKAISPGLLHKTEFNGVRLGIKNLDEMVTHWNDMQKTWPYSIWAEEQMPSELDNGRLSSCHNSDRFWFLVPEGSTLKYSRMSCAFSFLQLKKTSHK